MDCEPPPPEEVEWVNERRNALLEYLRGEGVTHGEVGDWPAWHVCPYVAIFAIGSVAAPGRVGWWAITGDLPTDYVSSRDAKHPREVLSHFARQWAELASYMLRGEPHPETIMGTPDDWPELGPLLESRSQILQRWAEDDAIWNETEE